MKTPSIGWHTTEPIPDQQRFRPYLQARSGQLYLDEVNLANLFTTDELALSSPLEIVYLPIIRERIRTMVENFSGAIETYGYQGDFFYAYASKANAAEEVVRTVLKSGANYEISSWVDIEIFRHMHAKGLVDPNIWVICNGFKQSGSEYSNMILQLKGLHKKVIPVLEDEIELPAFLQSDRHFDIGLRMKSYGVHKDLAEMDKANSRFGLNMAGLRKVAAQITAAPHLNFKLFHAMVGSQVTGEEHFVACLKPAIQFYAQLRQEYKTLEIFDFGGGMPVAMTLDFNFDYRRFASLLLETTQEICSEYGVPVPDIMGEFGRYSVAEHGAHIFKVLSVKDNGSNLPWYIIDGSVMSSLPDSWALGEHFIVLPLNHLDGPFRQVQIGGITCDSDDVYPPKSSRAALYLPEETNDLYIGFFSIGAYQEMLGGVGGSKHCVIPEADELIIDRDQQGRLVFRKINGQSAQAVLQNLGYR